MSQAAVRLGMLDLGIAAMKPTWCGWDLTFRDGKSARVVRPRRVLPKSAVLAEKAEPRFRNDDGEYEDEWS